MWYTFWILIVSNYVHFPRPELLIQNTEHKYLQYTSWSNATYFGD